MSHYRRAYVPGGSYFFTLVTERRAPILCNETSRACLSGTIRECQRRWPFRIDALVLLNNHLHAIWTLSEGDTRYSARWGWIKKEFTKAYLASGGNEQARSESRLQQRRRGVYPQGTSGNDGFGNMLCGMKPILTNISITSTTIRLNIVMCIVPKIGRIQAFTVG
jgi:REP element-mobilizing transposase RayT